MNQHRSSANQAQLRSLGYPLGGGPIYPGLGDAYPGFAQNPYAPVPAQAPSAGAKTGLLGNFNLNEIGTMINRMGGIDGILGTMGKVQKIFSGLQQMAPMFKLFAGSLFPGARTADTDKHLRAPRRRRRRKRRVSSARRKGGYAASRL